MPQVYWKRDVQLLVDQVTTAMKSVENLTKLAGSRELSSATTNLEVARFWLRELRDKLPESDN